MSEDIQAGWHLDNRVPIVLIFGLLAQAIGFGYWASTQAARIDALERWANSRPGYIPKDVTGRLYLLEGQQKNITGSLNRIESFMDKLEERLRLREQIPR